MNFNKSVVEKTLRKIKFPIYVRISTPSAVGILNPRETLKKLATVHIRKPQIRFPNKCVYCGTPSNTSHDVTIRKGNPQKLGSDNRLGDVWVEFIETYSVPFCQEHLKTFKQYTSINTIGYVLGFVLFAPLGYLFNPWNFENLSGLVFVGIVGVIGSVLISSVFIKFLARVSERFRALRHWPWFTIDVDEEIKFLSFQLYNKNFEKEFIEINKGWTSCATYLEKTTQKKENNMKKQIEVSPRGYYDSAPLLIDAAPDLEQLFIDPPIIQKPTEQNRQYWASANAEDRRFTLSTGYLQHPKPEVRLKTLELIGKYRQMGIGLMQMLFDLLAADSDEAVRREAARITWLLERDVNCRFAVNKANDEIAYGSESHPVGPTRARKALALLVEAAPDEDARRALEHQISLPWS
jgi:hypothetical protein